MPQHQLEPNSAERLKDAADNLRKILEEIARYEHKPKVEEISTAGTWRSAESALPQLVPETDLYA
jgi:hypothetical protein